VKVFRVSKTFIGKYPSRKPKEEKGFSDFRPEPCRKEGTEEAEKEEIPLLQANERSLRGGGKFSSWNVRRGMGLKNFGTGALDRFLLGKKSKGTGGPKKKRLGKNFLKPREKVGAAGIQIRGEEMANGASQAERGADRAF